MKKLLVIPSVLLLFFAACTPEKRDDKDTQAANDNAQMESMSNDAMNISDAAAAGQNTFKYNPELIYPALGGPCATVVRDTDSVSATRRIIIDFGSTNCLCNDGRNRRGIIKVTYNGSYFLAGSSRTITFINYFVNDYGVEGTHTVTNNGYNSSSHLTWTINAQNMKITRPDGKSHSWNSIRTREMIAGESTPLNWTDDIYLITGSASGTNINGYTYTASITSALRWELSCRWIVSGTAEITPDNKPTRSIDFGSGTCDDKATVTIGKKVYTITLP